MEIGFRLVFSVIAAITLVTTCSHAFAAFERQLRFSTVEELQEYLIQEDVVPSRDRIVIDTLYSYNDGLSIIAVKDSEATMMGSSWPILLVFKSNRGSVARLITWTPLTTRVASGELTFTKMRRVVQEHNGVESYMILASNTLRELIDEATGDIRCSTTEFMYLVQLDPEDTSINFLTKKPIPLSPTKTCGSTDKNTLEIESKGEVLHIKNTVGKLVPEQRSWQGKYIVDSGKLLRNESEFELHTHIKEADAQAIRYFRQSDIKTAIAVLSPFIEYSPPNVLDAHTVGAYNNYAFFLAEDGQLEDALIVLLKIVADFPERAVAHLNIGDVYQQLNQPEKARKHYQRYVQIMESSGKRSVIPERVLNLIQK